MKNCSRFVRIKIQWFVMLCFISICAIGLYFWQFEEVNAYIGILPLSSIYAPEYWLLLVFWLAVVTLLLPVNSSSPSDVFLCIYLLGSCLWTASYWPATGLLNMSQALQLLALLTAPAALIQFGKWLLLHFPLNVQRRSYIELPNAWLSPVLCGLLLLFLLLGYSVAGNQGSFDYDEGHLRRLSGRDSFAANNLAAYGMQMSVNGLAPLLGFLGAYRNKHSILIFSLGVAIFSYWLLATKSPFLSISMLAYLGYILRRGLVRHFTVWVLCGLSVLMLFVLVELWLFDFSMVADYGIRRLALVNANIQVYFMDAMEHQGWGTVFLSGLSYDGFSSPEYFVGGTYMGNNLTNANTNGYLHEMAIGGVVGYLVVSILTAIFAFTLDINFLQRGRVEAFGVAAIAAVLLLEQAFMTAMVSSGVGLCLLLVLLFSRGASTSKDKSFAFYNGTSS